MAANDSLGESRIDQPGYPVSDNRENCPDDGVGPHTLQCKVKTPEEKRVDAGVADIGNLPGTGIFKEYGARPVNRRGRRRRRDDWRPALRASGSLVADLFAAFGAID